MPELLKVATVTADTAVWDAVGNQVGNMQDVELAVQVDNTKDGFRDLRAARPDIVLVDLAVNGGPEPTLKWIERLKLEFPSTAVFVCSPEKAPELIMSAMRAGAQEFLAIPIDPGELARAVEKIRWLKNQTLGRDSARGKVVSVFSTKGGLGVSTIAVNLGVALAQISGREPALVDLDLQLGDVSSFLDLTPRYNILDACGADDAVDDSILQSCMTYHEAGVFVLAEPSNAADTSGVSGGQIKQILSRLRSMYPYVVADAAHSLDSRALAAFEESDTVLVVTVPNISSIRATKKVLSVFRNVGYAADKVKVVANRVHRKNSISIKDLERALDYDIYWTVPNNYPAVIESINTGSPLTVGKRVSNVGKAILELAERLADMDGSE